MDNTADMLSRMRNALKVKKNNLEVMFSKKNMAILNVLKEEGYIEDFKDKEVRKGVKFIDVQLKYRFGMPSIRELKLRSKQQRREYSPISKLALVYNGLGLSVISTSQGTMSDNEARNKNIGGEIICEVF